MDPATIGAIAAVGGAAIDFFSGDRAARKARKHTKKVATDEAYGSVMGRVEAAKAAGLHPSVALGTPTSSGANVGGGMTDFSSLAQNVANSYTQQRQWRAEQDMARAQQQDSRNAAQRAEARENARTNAELSHVQAQNDWISEQIRSSREESIRRNFQATKGVPIPVTAKASSSAAMPRQWIKVVDRFGKVIEIPNPDLYDLETGAILGAGTLGYPEVRESSTSGFINTVKQKYQQFRQQRRELDARNPRLNPYGLPTPIGD